MKQLLILSFSLSLTSCLPNKEESTPTPPPECASIANTYGQEQEPKPLPNLNVNPIYLEMKYIGWEGRTSSTAGLSYYGFKVAYSNVGYKSDIQIRQNLNSPPYYKNYKCKANISNAEFNSLVLSINSAKMCQSLVHIYDSCGPQPLSMALPSALYIVNEDGPLSINLNTYGSYENSTSFCDNSDVVGLQNQISDFYSNIDLEKDCELLFSTTSKAQSID